MPEKIVVQSLSASRVLQDAARLVSVSLFFGLWKTYGPEAVNKPIRASNGVFCPAMREVARNRVMPEWLSDAVLSDNGQKFTEDLRSCMVQIVKLVEVIPATDSMFLTFGLERAEYLLLLPFAGRPTPSKADVEKSRNSASIIGSTLLREIGRLVQNQSPPP
ncbi:MAG: hypothetical protein Q7K33_01000 [Candidatus Berkelbacteria bacterium]|nr:hypothetical protein [Candidatus Berkelbacteria bacterium]